MDGKTILMMAGGGLLLYMFTQNSTPAPAAAKTADPGPAPPKLTQAQIDAVLAQQVATANATLAKTSFNSLSSIYQRLVTAAAAGGVNPAVGVGPDAWNYYLMLPTVSTITSAPAPDVVFPGVDRNKSMTAVQYWSGMSDYLSKNNGLSGLDFQPRSRYFSRGGWLA